jgi:hypothetical protein
MKANGSSRNFDLILAPWGEEFRHESSAGSWLEPMEGAALLNAVAESFSTQMALPTMPDGANNRCADNWRPLVAIAEVAGGDWCRRATDAFDVLNESSVGCHRSPGSELLSDIRRIFQSRQAYKMASADLASELSALEGRPWAGLGQKHQSIPAHQIAHLLRPYGIVPRTIRLGSATIKGYHLADFTKAFQRFCPGP